MAEPRSRAVTAALELDRATHELVAEVQGLGPALIHWMPAEGVWTIMDILCHIREFVPFWTDEVLRIVRRPDEPWGRTHADPARLAAVADTGSQSLDAVLEGIERAVADAIARLGDLTDLELAKEATSKNPRWGLKPASFVVDDLLVEHVKKHLGQIRRNIRQFDERSPA
jgi:uncharacterized damage-inducible protein DinB